MWPSIQTERRSFLVLGTRRSKSGMVRSLFCSPLLVLVLTCALPSLAATTLELKSEKQNAHSSVISSVQFSPNGALIVSGSRDQTIKVWDAGTLARKSPCLTKTDFSCLLCRYPRAQGDQGERPRRLDPFGGVQSSGWQDNCVRLRGSHDQSLGLCAAISLKSPLLG